MRKRIFTFFAFLMFISGFVQAQNTFVPYFRFRADNNIADRTYLSNPGQFASQGWRYSDNSNMTQYHFKLSEFSSISSSKELYLRLYVWNEYVVKISDIAITSVNEGELAAQWSEDPEHQERDGTNQVWIDIPLSDYLAFGWDDFYVSIFDGRPQDGWGGTVAEIGFYYLEDDANIPDNNADVTLVNVDYISADGNVSDWPTENEWISIEPGSEGIITSGTVSDGTDLSASAALSFDKENLYFAAEVTDNQVVTDGDKVSLYIGFYSIGDTITQFGHRAIGSLTGFRNHFEPDYCIEVVVNETNPVVSETKIIGGELTDATVSVSKTSSGYTIEAKVPYSSLYLKDSVANLFTMDPIPFPDIINMDDVEDPYMPFAFKVEDYDGSGVEGSLITGTAADVDDNPSSWGLRTKVTDIRTEVDEETPKGIVKEYAVVKDDAPFLVEGYTGSGNSDSHRWADGTDTLVYHFNLTDIEALAKDIDLFLDFHVWNEFVVAVSGSLSGEKSIVARWSQSGIDAHEGTNEEDVEISLADMRSEGYEDIYVWFTDGDPDDGWGPGINRIRVFYKGEYKSTDIISFTPGTGASGDAPYLVADNGSQGDDSHRFADGAKTFGYKFNLNEIKAAQPRDISSELFFNVYLKGQYVVKVAQSETATPEEQEQVAIWSRIGLDLRDGSNLTWLNLPLQEYIDAGWENVVFFFSDGLTENGWGADLLSANVGYREVLAHYYIDEFTPGLTGSSESLYLVEGFTGSGYDDSHRWADNTAEIKYKFNKADLISRSTGNTDDVIFEVEVANEYIIKVSPSPDSSGTTIFVWDPKAMPMHDESNREVLSIALKEYFDMGWEDVYVSFTDGIPADGWGPSLRWAGLSTLGSVKTGSSDVAEGSQVPKQFALEQNFPNPFNPETIINYTVASHSNISLKIYDILGREVKTLVSQEQAPGSYSITWKGDNNIGNKVSSGVYFYRMLFNNNNQLVKKMVLLR